MLDTTSITCPKCGETTNISVSRGTTPGTSYATTSCRRCRSPFIALTQEDGRILIFDGVPPAPNEDPRLLGVIELPGGRSGYRIVPPEYLGIFDRGLAPATAPTGASDEELHNTVVSLGRVLRRPDGSPRAPADAAKFVGWRSVWVAQLNQALGARLSGPPPLSFPPAIFISYRWGMPADNQWVADLARNLTARGYPVVFDRDEPGDLDVPRLVSKIADCRYFLAILDAGYAERIGKGEDRSIADGWVFDEYNTAASLSNAKQLRIVGLLRSGSTLPRNFRQPVPGQPGNVVDVRAPEQLALFLDDTFPAIESGPAETVVHQARDLLASSHRHLCDERFEEAFAAAAGLTDLLPGVIDGPAQKVRVALRAGAADAGLMAAEEALLLAPESSELLRAAGIFAAVARQPRTAAQYLGLFLEAYGEEDADGVTSAHHALGSALDDLDQLYPAIAHLEIARHMSPADEGILNTLGVVRRRVDEMARPADGAGSVAAWITCSTCDARVPIERGQTLCARCGSVVSMEPKPCPCCTSTGRVVLLPGMEQQCPYCRRGRIVATPIA